MQILKENVKEDIINSAINEFITHGYKKTSMLNIANGAHVSVGNVYRYFKNKEMLLETILEPVTKDIEAFLTDITINSNLIEDSSFLLSIINKFIAMCEKYEARFNILINDSNESVTFHFNENLSDIVVEHLNKWLKPCNDDLETELLLRQALANSWLIGIRQLINAYYNNPDKLRVALHKYFLVIIEGLAPKLK